MSLESLDVLYKQIGTGWGFILSFKITAKAVGRVCAHARWPHLQPLFGKTPPFAWMISWAFQTKDFAGLKAMHQVLQNDMAVQKSLFLREKE